MPHNDFNKYNIRDRLRIYPVSYHLTGCMSSEHTPSPHRRYETSDRGADFSTRATDTRFIPASGVHEIRKGFLPEALGLNK